MNKLWDDSLRFKYLKEGRWYCASGMQAATESPLAVVAEPSCGFASNYLSGAGDWFSRCHLSL
jgi:hypothetical protein